MINPFRPNSPTNPEMFVGRYDEIKRIEGALKQTMANRGHSFLLLGERGIGKTSLLNSPVREFHTLEYLIPFRYLVLMLSAHNTYKSCRQSLRLIIN